jgi:PncC family amidohydrolase
MSDQLYEKIINLAKDAKLTISTCESVTAGMISSFLASVPGASSVFKGGLVVYSNHAKQTIANVSKKILDEYGAISEETANSLAINTNKILNTDISIAITGNAGPIPDENKPIGLAYLSICLIDKIYSYKLISSKKNRNDIRIDFASMTYIHLLDLLKEVIKNA